jgi:Na+-driven multidrug efflux pump
VASAAATLIGNSLGANDAAAARRLAHVAYVLECAWGLTNGGIAMAYRDYWGTISLSLSLSLSTYVLFSHASMQVACTPVI